MFSQFHGLRQFLYCDSSAMPALGEGATAPVENSIGPNVSAAAATATGASGVLNATLVVSSIALRRESTISSTPSAAALAMAVST